MELLGTGSNILLIDRGQRKGDLGIFKLNHFAPAQVFLGHLSIKIPSRESLIFIGEVHQTHSSVKFYSLAGL